MYKYFVNNINLQAFNRIPGPIRRPFGAILRQEIIGLRLPAAPAENKIQQAVFELNTYRTPDFTLLDASVGMPESHLWGSSCAPFVNRLAAGWDPVAIDCFGASLLGRQWQTIGHNKSAHGTLGLADPVEIIEV